MLKDGTTQLQSRFNQLVDQLLAEPDGDNDGIKFTIASGLSDLMFEISGFSADASMDRFGDITTDVGVAIMPVQAAKCLKEAVRSYKFLHGVKQAIDDRLTEADQVNVLYAGSGPWGSIVIPLLHLYQPGQVHITLLDIHQQNIDAVNKVITTLGLQDFFTSIELADATKWQPSAPRDKFHVIVSETMNTMLKREPQVSIFAHLQQFLASGGTLVPEAVTVECWAQPTKPARAEPGQVSPDRGRKITDLFTLDLDSAKQINDSGTTVISGQFALPEQIQLPCNLEFSTVICVYKDIVLGKNECSLNISNHLYQVAPNPGSQISWRYCLNQSPDWEFDVQSLGNAANLTDASVKSNSGLMYLHRFWDKYRRLPTTEHDPELLRKELPLDLLLMQALGMELYEAIAFINGEVPDLEEFESWIAVNQMHLEQHQITEFNNAVSAFS